MQIAAEMCRALCYKLQMFGVAIDYLMSVMCDNQSVQKNCSIHTSLLGLLSKKHNPICYHKVCESVATGWTRVDWVKSEIIWLIFLLRYWKCRNVPIIMGTITPVEP